MFIEDGSILNKVTEATGIALMEFGEFHPLFSGAPHISQQWQLAGAVLTPATFTFTQILPKSPLQTIIDDLERLEHRSNYDFKPSRHAMRSARLYIFETYARMGSRFPRPSFVLDGEKGIIIKWVHNGHTVRLNCLPDESDDDYIYFENGEYDTEDNVTIETLHNRLIWLTQHERLAR